MPYYLNLTLPMKQDEASQEAIKAFLAEFDDVQPKLNVILTASRDVHHARSTVIWKDGKVEYLQVLTEYDSDFEDYTVFFSRYLPEFFTALFAQVEGGGLTIDEVKDPKTLIPFLRKYDLPCMGKPELTFCAYPQSVKEIQNALGITVPDLPPLP